jgi:hypothetical protein
MAITSASSLPQQYVSDLGQDYAKQLTGLTSVPLDTSRFAPQVAAQDQLQTQAASLAGSGVGSYQPFLNQAETFGTQAASTLGGVSPFLSAAQTATGTGAGTGAGSIASYMSPYQQQVIDSTLSEFDKQAAIRQQNISDNAVMTGNFGGGREGVLQSEYQLGSDKNRALLNNQMLNQGFGQGAALRQGDFGNQLNLAGAQAGLSQGQLGLGNYQQQMAGLAPQLGRGDIATLTDIGGIQQGQSQNVLNAQAQGNQMQAMEPYQRLGVYGQGLGQVAQIPGTIQQQVTPDPTALQTALGTTSVVGGLMGLGSGYANQRAADNMLKNTYQ